MSETGAATLRRLATLTALLVGVDFLDEFNGVGFVGVPGIQVEFGITYTTAALVLFVLPGLIGLLVEPPLYVLADHYPRKRFVVGGLLACGTLSIAAGLAPNFVAFVIVMSLSGAASGVGVNLAQATLMDANPDARARMMTRWTFAGTAGDFATPALFAALATLALGWRAAFFVVGSLILVYTLVLATQRFPLPSAEAEAEEPSLREALRSAVRNRGLQLWLFGVWLCGLMDEILVAFAALHLRESLDATVAERSYVLMAFTAGLAVGLLVLERLLARIAPLQILAGSAALCAISYVAWLFAPTLASSAALLGLSGFFLAPLYPIAQAQAYGASPGRSGLVNAASQVFVPLSLVLPLALGFVADRFGLWAALTLLVLQPVGLLLIALYGPRLIGNRESTKMG